MFFSPELLARRDSGFGLLWLAATLGSKSTFKKLPKRSILTADIAELCDLIAEPSEPLALRLSSNLLIGVARVYKVKQEIFMTDVTNCFTSLKKVVQELQSAAVLDARLQMAQPSVRPSAVTLVSDPRVTIALDFDALVADWDEYLNIGDKSTRQEESDDEFNPKTQGRQKGRATDQPPPHTEAARGELHTLTEHHDHLLSTSFDISFHASHGDPGPSSSQAEANFGFDDPFFTHSDGLDIGGLADELAKELGWAESPVKARQSDLDTGMVIENDGLGNMDFDFGDGQVFAIDNPGVRADRDENDNHKTPQSRKRKVASYPSIRPSLLILFLLHEISSALEKENHGQPSPQQGILSPRALSPATSFSRLLLSQDEQLPLSDVTADEQNKLNRGLLQKKTKKTRLLLDARTELTDEELKTARTQYLEGQESLRRELGAKQLEKNRGRVIQDMVWGVPNCIHAPALVDFWQENFKVQVEARSGALHFHPREDPPRKRRKTRDTLGMDINGIVVKAHMDLDEQDFGMDVGERGSFGHEDRGHLRSSEEPGQARQLSRELSVFADLGFDLGIQKPMTGSQKSSLFPWDNAGGSSSSGAFGMPGSDEIRAEHVEIRLRGSSHSRRDSSLVPSQVGSFAGGPGLSPAPIRHGSQVAGEDYAFEVAMLDADQSTTLESQRSDLNLVSLERNSFNFLEYAKMQLHSLPSSTVNLTFDIVVPHSTSTRHVAASAFYHCLGAFMFSVISVVSRIIILLKPNHALTGRNRKSYL
ncbi:hypothetical protein Hypma_015537 [Hypsizygus marmoreus]|uniref:Rad21/Rec8-like protein N-terminal domain-containing protein n=1 Tax=Hypsizygus marmoreus TaxID=39966 RepID=A0A369K5C4_HYPMA|nr:hypothetical protein Hypma_015537 [Hypsizygus marmoreus]